MSYRHSNSSQISDDFHGLKDTISEADYSIDGSEEKKDKRKESKKFLFKKDSKDKGYSTLAGDTSQDSVFLVNTKNYKKPKTDNKKATLNVFKKSKDEKRLKDIKESKEDLKRNKKTKDRLNEAGANFKHEHLFGNSLENAVANYASNDGVKVPYPIRMCIDIIEQKGIEMETIYRHSTNKSQIESICESINMDKIESRLDELNNDPNMACAIVKKFFKELKSPLVPDDALSSLDKFDPNLAADKSQKVDYLKKVISKMPQTNYETFAYMIMHFHRVLKKNDVNKIEIGLFVQKFQPLFRIKERMFKFFILNADQIFSDYRFKKCRLKINDEANSRFSLLPDSIEDLEKEIEKQEVYLAKLHSKIANEEHSTDKTVQEQLCDELWGLQRYVTSLKRKVKKLKMERKLIENEQIKNITEATNKANQEQHRLATEANKLKDEHTGATKTTSDDANPANQGELVKKEIGLICDNLVLIESVQQYLNQINKEKQLITEMYQKMANQGSTASTVTSQSASTNVGGVLQDTTNLLGIHELKENEQMIINENKLFEERINLINKRIRNEKDKIHELKLNIKLKTLDNLNAAVTVDQQSNSNSNSTITAGKKSSIDINIIGRLNPIDNNKELIMTKL